MKLITDKSGFTLIEMIVSAFILVIVVVAASQMYVTASSAQRRAHGKQNALDATRYALEYMGRSIRQSEIPPDAFISSSQIYIIHPDQEKCQTLGGVAAPCRVYFRRENNRLREAIVGINAVPQSSSWRDITGFNAGSEDTTNVILENLRFSGTAQDSGVHPKVTISMTVRPELKDATEESRVRIQTTITSRDPRWLSTQ